MPYEDLLALNPGYNRPLAAGGVRTELVVPAEQADHLRLSLERYREEREQAERQRVPPSSTRRKR